RIDPAGKVTAFAEKLRMPVYVAVDASTGDVYVSSTGTFNDLAQSITKITPDGVQSKFASTTDVKSPMGLGVDADHNVYVACNQDGAVKKIAADGAVSVFATGLKYPNALAVEVGHH